MTDEALAREAIRVYRRYAVEIVEGLSFCPYAERARTEGRTEEIVIVGELPTDEAVGERIEEVAEDEQIEIGLVVFPRLTLSRPMFGRWVEILRKQHAARRGSAVLALEGFHPDAEADLSNAERLTPFVRRTPDPTIQLTRLRALERVRRGTPTGTAYVDPSALDLDVLSKEVEKRPLHERIADLNLETVRDLGVEAVEDKLEDILRDRDRSYRAIDPSIVARAST